MGRKTIKVHGKEYETVASRLTRCKEENPEWSIETELVFHDKERVIIKAFIKDESGRVRGTGHAEEDRTGLINSKNAMENAETSAIGRALAACGYHGTEYASAEEMANSELQKHLNGMGRCQTRDELQTFFNKCWGTFSDTESRRILTEKHSLEKKRINGN